MYLSCCWLYPSLEYHSAIVIVSVSLGKDWIKQMLVGASLFPGLICGTAFMINFIAIYYHASRAIPFLTMVSFMCMVQGIKIIYTFLVVMYVYVFDDLCPILDFCGVYLPVCYPATEPCGCYLGS